MKTLFNDDNLVISEDGSKLTVDVSGAGCPEYTMLFCRAIRKFKKPDHSHVHMITTAESIAQLSIQARLEATVGINISNHDIKHKGTEKSQQSTYNVHFSNLAC